MGKKEYYVRIALSKDINKIVNLEYITYGHQGFTTKKIKQYKDHSRHMILLCESESEELYGYLVYTWREHKLKIIRLVVDPDQSNKGVGTALIDKLKTKLRESYPLIEIVVEDDNLAAHMFLKHNNFKATEVIRGGYEENDQYLFVYQNSVLSEPA